jgi:hypothetical protein
MGAFDRPRKKSGGIGSRMWEKLLGAFIKKGAGSARAADEARAGGDTPRGVTDPRGPADPPAGGSGQ